MTKIYLARHGQDEDNAADILNGRRDTNLTELGRQQAKEIAGKLKGYKIDVIYTSPLHRAYDSARIIAEDLGVDQIVVDHHLIERDFGILTGKPMADIPKYAEKRLVTNQINYFLQGEGIEEFSTTYQRAQKILEEIKQQHAGDTILIVTHGAIVKMIQAAYYHWDWKEGLLRPTVNHSDIIELE